MIEKVKLFIEQKLGSNYVVIVIDEGKTIQVLGKHQQNISYIKRKIAKILDVSTIYLETFHNTILLNSFDLELISKQESEVKKIINNE